MARGGIIYKDCHSDREIVLYLTPEEARYIKELVQNWHGPEGDFEDPRSNEIRGRIFHTLPPFDELY